MQTSTLGEQIGQSCHVLSAGPHSLCCNNAPDPSEHREHVEPWLSALFQTEHMNLLVGSGFTQAIAGIAKSPQADMAPTVFSCEYADVVEAAAKRSASELGRTSHNVEDQIRCIRDLLAGLRVLTSVKKHNAESFQKKAGQLKDYWMKALDDALCSLLKKILDTERGIRDVLSGPPDEAQVVRRYLGGFLLPFASRTPTRDRLHIFTTNYDRLLEYGCDILGVHVLDRFIGHLNPVFRSSRLGVDLHYNPPGIRGEPRYLEGVVRLSKLHGAIDWRTEGASGHSLVQRSTLPFGAPPNHPEIPIDAGDTLLIYPNPAKDVETLEHPYAELFRDFAAAICRPNSVVVTYGYGFGDSHINRTIQDMLSIPSTHLVVISYDDADGRLSRFFADAARQAQITLLVGPHFGDLCTLVDSYLPKPAIDRNTWRMMELLSRRGALERRVTVADSNEQATFAMRSPVELIGDHTIGIVEEVLANKVTVLLGQDAPQTTALNTGTPAGFPRVNGYVLVPNEQGSTVCVVTSVRINRLPAIGANAADRDFVKLPISSRTMTLTPLGTIKTLASRVDALDFAVRRGIEVFPSVGDPVILPNAKQLEAIVEGESRTEKRIHIGGAPTAGMGPVYVDPDKLFGRHLAVLGNTGAGKSCSVAGLVRWSLDAARNARKMSGEHGEGTKAGEPNARFIILDPNGEYAHAFKDLNVRVFGVEPRPAERQLGVPAWLWNGNEWAAFTQASPGVQRPLLFQALRLLRGDGGLPISFESHATSVLRIYGQVFQISYSNGDHTSFPQYKSLTINLESACSEVKVLVTKIEAPEKEDVKFQALKKIGERCKAAAEAGKDDRGYNQPIPADHMQFVLQSFQEASEVFHLTDRPEIDEDLPRPFDVTELPKYVEALAALRPGRDLAQFVDTLNLRIHSLLGHDRLASILKPDDSSITLDAWLEDHIGADEAGNGPIAVVDLSLVPSDVAHVVVSVLARMIFEAVQRYRRENHKELPTTLVLEEAHTFVHRDLVAETASSAGRACAREFERIAREGRKFGLGLVLASQRPSEVAPTVLSQCNTFLLHRIVNDRDQDLVRRLVPEGLGDLLRELPSLPTRRAILLGWATAAPTLVEVREIPDSDRPHSPDPAFWDVWTGKQERPIDWAKFAKSWQA